MLVATVIQTFRLQGTSKYVPSSYTSLKLALRGKRMVNIEMQ